MFIETFPFPAKASLESGPYQQAITDVFEVVVIRSPFLGENGENGLLLIMLTRTLLKTSVCLTLFLAFPFTLRADNKLDFFEKKIRPILAQECYECHSVATKQENDLALDTREGWKTGGYSGPAIEPGKPEESLLLRTIRHQEPDMHMPKAGAKLSDEIIADFEKWIEMGADDPRDHPPTKEEVERARDWPAIAARRSRWWSFQPIADPPIPPVGPWSNHPIDRYLLKAASEVVPAPSPDANAMTVLRRLHFALTGLPATEVEMEEFNESWQTNGPDRAVLSKIDQLLSSPHYGERWARHWMDWFRYAEGHGGQGDFEIAGAFEYRDYLIRALNADVPYDRLIQEHIAGDLLPNPRINSTEGIVESRIGPAHLRMVEHGFFPVDSLDELVKFTDNQIDVVTKAILGLTVSCARCHDHKFDPISHRDYYALFGVFASSRPASLPINDSSPLASRKERLAQLRAEFVSAIRRQWYDEAQPNVVEQRLRAWLDEREAAQESNIEIKAIDKKSTDEKAALKKESAKLNNSKLPAVAKTSALYPWMSLRTKLKTSKTWDDFAESIAKQRSDSIAHNESITLQRIDFSNGLPVDWKAMEGTLRAIPPGELGLGVTEETAVLSILPAGLFSASHTSFEEAVATSADFIIPNAATAVRWSGTGMSWIRLVPNNFPMANSGNGIYGQNHVAADGTPKWHNWNMAFWKNERGYFHVMTDRSASGRHALLSNEDGTPSDDGEKVTRGSWWHLSEFRRLREPKDKIEETAFAVSPLLEADSPSDEGSMIELYASTIRRELEALQANKLTDDGAEFLTDCIQAGLLRGKVNDLRDDVRAALEAYRRVENELPSVRIAPGLLESDGFDQALLVRGNHRQTSDAVPRGFLAALGGRPFSLENESGRLQLANELTRFDSPLFARVMVNRLWHHVYGVGLVKSTDNFGHTGAKPSHPELLDHLARRFQQDWSIKNMLRYILSTRTFRLQSEPSTAAKKIDPANRYYSHANVRRLEGEIVRDHLLVIGGTLDSKLFGPSKKQNSPSNRRSIYLRIDRTSQGPLQAVFDVPMPTTTRGARDISTTPAQAIAFLNSPFVRKQTEAWADSVINEDPIDALKKFYRIAFTREPVAEEVEVLEAFFREQRTKPAQALADTAHLILNLKEFIFIK